MRAGSWLLPLLASCSLEQTVRNGVVPSGFDAGEPGPDGGGTDPDGGPGSDAGGPCTAAIAPPLGNATIGARVRAVAEVSCPDDPAGHTCSWQAIWNDDTDGVRRTQSSDRHPCSAEDEFELVAEEISDDPSSFYRVELRIDGQPAADDFVFVGGFRSVGQGLDDVLDIAFDAADGRAWLATRDGLAVLRSFDDEDVEVLRTDVEGCDAEVVGCPLSTVTVADGWAWTGATTSRAEIARARISGEVVEHEAIALDDDGPCRSIVSAVDENGDPGVFVSTDRETFWISRLDEEEPLVGNVLLADGFALDRIVATWLEPGQPGGALWRLESGADGRLERLGGGGLDPIAPEDVLDRSGSALGELGTLLVVAQRDGDAFGLDLSALDLGAAQPLEDASFVLELQRAGQEPGALGRLADVVDIARSGPGDARTLWAVSSDTLYRIEGGTVFEYLRGELPDEDIRSIAVVDEEDGDEVILLGTADGLWMSRASFLP